MYESVKYDFDIRQGATIEQKFTFLNPDGSDFDFTGYSARSQMRQNFSSSMAFNLNPSLSANELTLNMTDIQSAAISILSNNKTSYVYDIELINSLGKVWKAIHGTIGVYPEATK